MPIRLIPIWVPRVKLSRTATLGPPSAGFAAGGLRSGGEALCRTQTDFPALTVRAISAVGVEVPMTYALGTSRGRITKAPLAADRRRDRRGGHRPLLPVVLFPARDGGDREPPPGGRGAHQGRAHRARRTLEQARRTLRADRRAGHRPHGDGGLRRRLLGRAGYRGRRAAGAAARRRAAPHPGLQFLRARADAERGAGRRGREAARTRLPRGQAPARLSDARRRSRGGARRQGAHPARVSR